MGYVHLLQNNFAIVTKILSLLSLEGCKIETENDPFLKIIIRKHATFPPIGQWFTYLQLCPLGVTIHTKG